MGPQYGGDMSPVCVGHEPGQESALLPSFSWLQLPPLPPNSLPSLPSPPLPPGPSPPPQLRLPGRVGRPVQGLQLEDQPALPQPHDRHRLPAVHVRTERRALPRQLHGGEGERCGGEGEGRGRGRAGEREVEGERERGGW